MERIKLNFLLKLSHLNLNFELTLGYLDTALNNATQSPTIRKKANQSAL